MSVRVYVHTCGGPVFVDQAGPYWRFLDRQERPITHCPRCRRRLTRARLVAVDRDVRQP